MAAVPVHEVGRRPAARQVLAGDAEPPVAHRAGRVHHGVVAAEQVVPGDVRAEVHAADERDAGRLKDAAQVVRDRLDRLVVRRHAVADKAVRGGEPVEHVDADRDR